MTNKLVLVLTLFSALGCGLIGGVFFAFSTFVMKALAALSPPQGIAAMKSIKYRSAKSNVPWNLSRHQVWSVSFWLSPQRSPGTNRAPH